MLILKSHFEYINFVVYCVVIDHLCGNHTDKRCKT